MLRMLRKTGWHLIALAVLYVGAPLIVFTLRDAHVLDEMDALSLTFTLLVGLNPMATFLAGGLLAYRHGFVWLLIPAVLVIWLPALLVYNDSALPYGFAYMAFALVGLLAGRGIRTLVERRAATH